MEARQLNLGPLEALCVKGPQQLTEVERVPSGLYFAVAKTRAGLASARVVLLH